MDLYTAFMRTADRMERNPVSFNICEVAIPGANSYQGCVLGWIGHEMGYRENGHADDVLKLLGLSHFSDFTTRMLDLHSWNKEIRWFECPSNIRDYANKYLQKPVTPDVDPALLRLLKGLDTFFTEKA